MALSKKKTKKAVPKKPAKKPQARAGNVAGKSSPVKKKTVKLAGKVAVKATSKSKTATKNKNQKITPKKQPLKKQEKLPLKGKEKTKAPIKSKAAAKNVKQATKAGKSAAKPLKAVATSRKKTISSTENGKGKGAPVKTTLGKVKVVKAALPKANGKKNVPIALKVAPAKAKVAAKVAIAKTSVAKAVVAKATPSVTNGKKSSLPTAKVVGKTEIATAPSDKKLNGHATMPGKDSKKAEKAAPKGKADAKPKGEVAEPAPKVAKKPVKTFFREISQEDERIVRRGNKVAASHLPLDVQNRRRGNSADESPEELVERIEKELEHQHIFKRNLLRPQMCTKCGINVVSVRFTIDKELGYCDDCAEILHLGETKEARKIDFHPSLMSKGEEGGAKPAGPKPTDDGDSDPDDTDD